MKNKVENMSEVESLRELNLSNARIEKLLEAIEKKMPDPNKPTLAQLGYMDNADLMLILKISRTTAAKLRDSGELRYTKVRGRILYLISDVKEMLQQNFKRN